MRIRYFAWMKRTVGTADEELVATRAIAARPGHFL